MNGFPDWEVASLYPNDNSYKHLPSNEDGQNVGYEDSGGSKIPADDPLFRSKAWAWQFLRRNPKYQSDYEKWVFERKGKKNIIRVTPDVYGLLFFLDYHIDEPPYVPFVNTLSLKTAYGNFSSSPSINLLPEEIAIVFNLSLPIGMQLNLASMYLQEQLNLLKKRDLVRAIPVKRKRSRELQRYLRVIDARRKKVSFQDIAQQFIKERLYIIDPNSCEDGVARTKRDWRAAKKLMLEDYRWLAFS